MSPRLPKRLPETCGHCGGWVYHRTEPCGCPRAEYDRAYTSIVGKPALPILPAADDFKPESCGSCRFAKFGPIVADGQIQVARCRRGLRHVLPTSTVDRVTWPVHALTDWCGEYQRDATPPPSNFGS